MTLGLVATGMTVVAALLVVAVLTYRFDHSHTPSSQLPRWVSGVPPVASALSFIALGVQLVASRVSRAQRKRLEAVYTAAGATAAGSDLPTWLSWLRPGCAPVASASAQALAVVVLVASVGTTVAGSSLSARLASAAAHPTATATLMPTMTATPSGPRPASTSQITDSRLRQANSITSAADGSLWWSGQGGFGHLSPGGAMTTIPYPSAWSTTRFGDTMLAAPDGTIWFTEFTSSSIPASANRVGKITPSGAITEYPLTHANNGPGGMAVGPDGNIWFTEIGNRDNAKQPINDGVIGRVTANGMVTEYKLPVSGAHPAGLTKGPDNNLWFDAFTSSAPDSTGTTTIVGDYIGRITPSGVITLYQVTGQSLGTGDIITGPDGAVWFGLGNFASTTGSQPATIGRITVSGQFLSSISLAALNDTTIEYGLPSNFVVASTGAVYFGNFAYQTSATAGTIIYGPLIYVTPQGNQPETLGHVGNLECYAVSAGPNGSIACAEDSDIQTITP